MLILIYAFSNMKRIQKSSMTYLESVSHIINMNYMHASNAQSSLRITIGHLESLTFHFRFHRIKSAKDPKSGCIDMQFKFAPK